MLQHEHAVRRVPASLKTTIPELRTFHVCLSQILQRLLAPPSRTRSREASTVTAMDEVVTLMVSADALIPMTCSQTMSPTEGSCLAIATDLRRSDVDDASRPTLVCVHANVVPAFLMKQCMYLHVPQWEAAAFGDISSTPPFPSHASRVRGHFTVWEARSPRPFPTNVILNQLCPNILRVAMSPQSLQSTPKPARRTIPQRRLRATY